MDFHTNNDGLTLSRAIERGPRDSLEYNTRVRPDGTFPPAMDGRDPADEAEHDVESIWHHDAAEYMPIYPKPEDMWERWRFEVEGRECDAVVEEPWWSRRGMAEPTACTRKLKDVATLDVAAGVWRLR